MERREGTLCEYCQMLDAEDIYSCPDCGYCEHNCICDDDRDISYPEEKNGELGNDIINFRIELFDELKIAKKNYHPIIAKTS
jgi:hypothetical protein